MLRKCFIRVGLAVVMACVTLVAQQSPAAAAPVKPLDINDPGAQWIEGHQSGKCINDPNNSLVDGTQMIIYHCKGFSNTSNEDWNFQVVDLVGSTYYYWIWNSESRKCLTVQGASTLDNAPIIQYTCNTGSNEEWSIPLNFTDGGGQNWRLIRARNSNKCVTVQNLSSLDGAKLLQYTCNSGDNQNWAVYPPPL